MCKHSPRYRTNQPSLVAPSFYCTSAITDAAQFRTNVQLWVSLSPLEQAPDQIAVLPATTESVIAVPTLNGACVELPTVTLIPAGFEAICCPLRPVAVTVSVAVVTVLTVRDYGRGIPEETLRTFREHGLGVGVALSGMRERINELGGNLEVTSDHTGTIISAKLPLSKPQANETFVSSVV